MVPSKTTPSVSELTTYRLRSWNETYAVQDKRYFHAIDGNWTRTVEITRDLRVSCRCKEFRQNLQTGAGPCIHAADAIDFVDNVG